MGGIAGTAGTSLPTGLDLFPFCSSMAGSVARVADPAFVLSDRPRPLGQGLVKDDSAMVAGALMI